MKKLIFVLSALAALSLLAPTTSSAQYDDQMAIVFETAPTPADTLIFCTDAAPYNVFVSYVVVLNPTMAAIYGYEFGFTVEGGAHVFSGITLLGTGPIDVGGVVGNHIVGLGAPITVVAGGLTVIAEITIIPTAADPIYYTLTEAVPNSIVGSGRPVLLIVDSGMVSAGLSNNGVGYTAVLNGVCEDVVAAEPTSWDNLKSLYR